MVRLLIVDPRANIETLCRIGGSPYANSWGIIPMRFCLA